MAVKNKDTSDQEDVEQLVLSELIGLDEYREIRIEGLLLLEKIKFENHDYQLVFNALKELILFDKEIDIITLHHSCQEVPFDIVHEIMLNNNGFVNPKLFLAHIEFLQGRDYKKELLSRIHKSIKLIETGQSSLDLDEVRNGLIADLSTLTREDKAHFENIKQLKEQIIAQMNSGSEIEGFSWGISDLDLWTSGIVIPRVYVIGGLKKSGKTRFLIHTIKELHKQQVPTVFLSMEMPGYEVTKLLHSSFTGINDLRFRSSSRLKSEELSAFQSVEINERIFGLECKSGLKLDQVLSRIRRYAKMGFKVIMIDYLQRISHDRNKQAQELEDIAIRLADSARQNNVALLLLSQLNALGERETPNMGHLKGSGGIGEAADVIFLFDNLFRRTKEEKDRNKVDVYIEQRHGDSGLAHLWADLGSCRLNNLATQNQIEEHNETVSEDAF